MSGCSYQLSFQINTIQIFHKHEFARQICFSLDRTYLRLGVNDNQKYRVCLHNSNTTILKTVFLAFYFSFSFNSNDFWTLWNLLNHHLILLNLISPHQKLEWGGLNLRDVDEISFSFYFTFSSLVFLDEFLFKPHLLKMIQALNYYFFERILRGHDQQWS